jgi:O-antigen/teichoic acid export membrane protein
MNGSQAVRNAISNYGRLGVTAVSTVLLTPLVLSRVGAEGYGIWMLALTITTYFSMGDFGISGAAVRYLARDHALGDWASLNRTIGTSLSLFLLVGLGVGAATVALVLATPIVFRVSPSGLEMLRLLIANMGFASIIGFVATVPIQCVIAAQRLDQLNMRFVVVDVLSGLATAIGIGLGGGIGVLAAVQLGSSVAFAVIGYYLARRFMPEARFRPHWSWPSARTLVAFGAAAATVSLAGRVVHASDLAVISTFMSLSDVAPFALALRGIQLLRALVNAGSSVLGVFASAEEALGNRHELTDMWMRSTKWSLAATLPVVAIYVLLGPEVITAWVGPGFGIAGVVLGWLALGHLVDLSQSGAFQVLFNSGHQSAVAKATIVEAAVNLGLSIALIPSLGLVGVAVGTTIPMIARAGVFYPLWMRHTTGVTLRSFARLALWPGFVAAVPALVLVAAFRFSALPKDRVTLVGLGFTAALAVAIMSCRVFLNAQNRHALRLAVPTWSWLPTRIG